MKKYKLNWYFWIYVGIVAFFLIASPFMIKAGFFNEIIYENDKPDQNRSLFLSAAFTFIFIVYLISALTIIRIIFRNKLVALKITDHGIEDTCVFLQFLALFIVLPVKFIPWEAVTLFEDKGNNKPYVKLNTKLVEAGFLAKTILRFTGYDFHASMVKPKVTFEEVKNHKKKFSI